MRTETRGELQDLLEEAMSEHDVPGVALAVLEGDDEIEIASGVINKATGIQATNDTLFQIGSITKVWTATLIMQLVDQGKVELDAPVRNYIKGLKFADQRATETITVGQLLCHSSGLDGDRFEDTGRGDDCVEEFVAGCRSLPQVAAPGELFSYSNAAYVILGRVVEAVTGQVWDTALEERLIQPIGLQRTVTLPEDALLHRTAIGHIDPTCSGELTPAPVWSLPRSAGPAANICSTSAELIKFARLHLDGGVARDGTRVLSPESVTAMQEQHIQLVDRTIGTGWGLGWNLYNWDGVSLFGHDGGTLGQKAFLRIVPEDRFALVLLTNGMTGQNVFKSVVKEIFAERFGIEVPELSDASEKFTDFDPDLYAGVYQNEGGRTTVESHDDGLLVTIELTGPAADVWPAIKRVPLRPIAEAEFGLRWPGYDSELGTVFFDFDETDRPRYIHWGGRASPRIANGETAL